MLKQYIPDRADIIWLDFEPKRGKEIGKYRPALVLSSRQYQKKTGLLICCPISTSVRGGVTEVLLTHLKKPCVVASHIIQTLSWRDRYPKWITRVEPSVLDEVYARLLPLIGVEDGFLHPE